MIVIVPDVAFHLVPGDTMPIDVATFCSIFFLLYTNANWVPYQSKVLFERILVDVAQPTVWGNTIFARKMY